MRVLDACVVWKSRKELKSHLQAWDGLSPGRIVRCSSNLLQPLQNLVALKQPCCFILRPCREFRQAQLALLLFYVHQFMEITHEYSPGTWARLEGPVWLESHG